MIYCTKCGTELPDDAKFCLKCGAPLPGAGAAAAPAGAPTVAPAGAQQLTCPSCGAPIKPVLGEMVITCDYCGGTVSLGGAGWKEISKHTMLSLKVADESAALATVHEFVDASSIFHRHLFEQSTVEEAKLSYVPFWIIPASAATTYRYEAIAASVGATVGTIAAAELLGSALGGGRRFGPVIPIMAGPVVNPTRSETISGTYEYPVVAVKSLSHYQPKDYQFRMGERALFDRKAIPSGTPILNGDLGEEAARGAAKAFVEQLQSEAAHKKHSMVSGISCHVDLAEGELLHVPIWYFSLERKGTRTIVLIDGHAGRVIRTMV